MGNGYFVAEPNNIMKSLYFILDDYMYILNESADSPTPPILKLGVKGVLKCVIGTRRAFVTEGGCMSGVKLLENVKVMESF